MLIDRIFFFRFLSAISDINAIISDKKTIINAVMTNSSKPFLWIYYIIYIYNSKRLFSPAIAKLNGILSCLGNYLYNMVKK